MLKIVSYRGRLAAFSSLCLLLAAAWGCSRDDAPRADTSDGIGPTASADSDSKKTAEQKRGDRSKRPAKQARPPQNPPQSPDAQPPDPHRFRMAAYEGNRSAVERFLEAGANVEAADPKQQLTALHMAAYNGHSEIVQLLLARGAEVDARDHQGKTPLTHACTGPFPVTVKILLGNGAGVNSTESTEGFTPLMMAAGLGQTEVVKVLLDHDADANLADADGDTAADHAANAGHQRIVALIEE